MTKTEFSDKPGSPRAYGATIDGKDLNIRQFIRRVTEAQATLIQQQRGLRHTSGEYGRIQKALDKLADARYFETLQRPWGTRREIYDAAALVIQRGL